MLNGKRGTADMQVSQGRRRPLPVPTVSPAAALSRDSLRLLLVISAAAHVVATVAIAPSETVMRHANGRGIVAFELAGSADRAAAIMSSWGPSGRRAARRSLVYDFGYMLTYGGVATVMVEFARRRLSLAGRQRLAVFGPTVVWMQPVAVACDAVEGVALLRVLHGRGPGGMAALARRAALIKFACLGAGLAYYGLGLMRRSEVRSMDPAVSSGSSRRGHRSI